MDQTILEAALVGYQHQIEEIEAKMSEIRRQLGNPDAEAEPTAETEPKAKRRSMTAAARRRISAAQKKRWADFHKTQDEPALPKKKRVLSAAGRKRIADATRKRWAEHRAKKAAALKGTAKAGKAGKRAAKKAAAQAPVAAAE